MSAYRKPDVEDVKIKMTGNDRIDFAQANGKAGLDQTPDGWTWNHHQDGETMQLVPKDLNNELSHTGGAAIANAAKKYAEENGISLAGGIAGAAVTAVAEALFPNTASAIQNEGASMLINGNLGSTLQVDALNALDPGIQDVGQLAVTAFNQQIEGINQVTQIVDVNVPKVPWWDLSRVYDTFFKKKDEK